MFIDYIYCTIIEMSMVGLTRFAKPLVVIFALALVLRIYQLGIFPFGFHADEVRVGWNAYSILKTGEDDRGNRFALYYNTFGDYRPTGIFYLTIPSVLVFGTSEFAIRFPAALLGALTIFPLYFFVRELTKNQKLGIIAAGLLAVSPWHISTSRSTSEVVVALFLALLGLYFFIQFLNGKDKRFVVASVILLGVSYLFYHSVRLLAPLFIGAIIIYYWRNVDREVRTLAIGGFLVLSLFTFLLSLDPQARGRFSQVSIFNDLDAQYELTKMPFEEGPNRVFIARLFHNKPSVYARRFIKEYARYFSPDFLISEAAKPSRYMTTGMGLLTYIEAFLFIAGLVMIAQGKANILPLLLLLIAPIPAALTIEDAPNLQRAFFMVPFISIIGAYGLVWLVGAKQWGNLLLRGSIVLLAINFIFYLHMYYVHNKVHIPLYRNIGAKELALKLNEIQKDYDKIILTNIPDDPYPWIAFFTGRDPAVFNKDAVKRKHGVWSTENFEFTGLRCPSRDAFNNTDIARLLVVDGEACADASQLKDRDDIQMIQILRPDGSEVYTLWSRIE